jgi:hypothetical protein
MRTCFVLALLAAAGAAEAKPVKVTPNRDWVAVVNDENLKKQAPKDGVVTDAKTFEALWKAWRGKEKVPAVDFTKEFAVVTLASGPNRPSISATLDEGDLKIQARQTLIGGDGFGYSIATFNRKDVKKVNGKELPAK